MTYEVILTNTARQKIRDQAAYITAELKEQETASRWLQRVLDAASSLESMPERCERAEEDAYLPYEVRARRIGTYMLLYTVVEETKTVWIVNARHGRQLPQAEALPGLVEDLGDRI